MIKTDRILIRRWEQSDCEAFVELAEDPEIRKWTGRTVPSEELFRYYLTLDTSFAVEMEGKVIGNVSFFRNSTTSSIRLLNIYECAFYFLPDFQGKGYAAEALKAACAYMFGTLHTDAVLIGVLQENTRAIEFVERNGGKYCFERTNTPGDSEKFYVIV